VDFKKILDIFKNNRSDFCGYLICAALSILGLIWILQLWRADIWIPFAYAGDALAMSSWVKGLIDNPWWYYNSYLGMPFGQEHFDFPLTSTIDLLILKTFGFVFQDFAAALNIFYIITFPLTAITSLYVFRKLGVATPLGIFGSLLYTYIPYHFFRGLPHIFFSSYYLLPLVVLIMIWMYEDKPIIFNFNTHSIELRNYYTLSSVVICGLLALYNIYYCFFACFFFLVVGVIKSIQRRSTLHLVTSLLLIGFVVSLLITSVFPVLLYQHEHGSNKEAAIRSPAESELYGLKITQLIIPIPGHRIPEFAEINRGYSSSAPLVTENYMSGLGLIGVVGFIFLILWVFVRYNGTSYPLLSVLQRKLDCLSTLNLSAVLLATIGGFSAIVAYGFFNQIRGYNRISIFIAFFAIATIVLLLDLVYKKYCFTKKRRILFVGLLCVLLIGGVLDQTSPAFVPDYESTQQQYLIDKNFIEKIEGIMPKNAMIFQLPYVPYPEHPPVYRMTDYELIKGYLHSHQLHWSYGAMKGRDADQWQEAVVNKPVDEMIFLLSTAGFNGIYIDSYGYEDGGTHLISTVSNILGTSPIISDNSRLYFFDMTEYNQQMQTSKMTQQDIHLAMNGWHGLENWAEIPTQWMTDKATLLIYSSADHNATINFQVVSFHRQRSLDIYANDQFVQQTAVPTSFVSVSIPIQLQKGENIIRLHVPEGAERPCDIPELNNKDTRPLSIAVQNVTVLGVG